VPAPPQEQERLVTSKAREQMRRRQAEIARAREKCRQDVLEMERTALPGKTIYPKDLEELGIAPFEFIVTRTRKQAERDGSIPCRCHNNRPSRVKILLRLLYHVWFRTDNLELQTPVIKAAAGRPLAATSQCSLATTKTKDKFNFQRYSGCNRAWFLRCAIWAGHSWVGLLASLLLWALGKDGYMPCYRNISPSFTNSLSASR
jgi:hypothetical protein